METLHCAVIFLLLLQVQAGSRNDLPHRAIARFGNPHYRQTVIAAVDTASDSAKAAYAYTEGRVYLSVGERDRYLGNAAGKVRRLRLSKDGLRVVALTDSGRLSEWVADRTGKFAEHDGLSHWDQPVRDIWLLPNGDVIGALANHDKVADLQIVNLSQGGVLARIPGTQRWKSFELAPRGDLIIVVDERGHAALWRIVKGSAPELLAGMDCEEEPVVWFDDSGAALLARPRQSSVEICNIKTGERIQRFPGEYWWFAVSVDGDKLVTVSQPLVGSSRGAGLRMFNVSTGEELPIADDEQRNAILSAGDGRLWIWNVSKFNDLWSSNSQLHGLWRISNADRLKQTGHGRPVTAVAFNSRGDIVASAAAHENVLLWDIAAAGQPATLEGLQADGQDIEFSPDGKLVAATLAESEPPAFGGVAVWKADERTVLAALPSAGGFNGSSVSFLSSKNIVTGGALLAGGSILLGDSEPEGSLIQWPIESLSRFSVLEGLPDTSWPKLPDTELWRFQHSVYSMDVAADSSALAIAGLSEAEGAGYIWLWDLQTGKLIKTLGPIGQCVTSVSLSRDGQWVAAAISDVPKRPWHQLVARNVVHCWDVDTGQLAAVLEGHESSVTSVAFAPSNNLLASSSWDGTVRLWDVGAKSQLECLRGHDSRVESLAFSPDGTRLASGSADTTILLWDVSHLLRQ